MTTMPRTIGWVVSVVLATAGSGAAQSLGDVARRSAAQRGATSKAAKVYSNGDLTPDFTTPESPTPSKPAEPDGETPATDSTAEADKLEFSPVSDTEAAPPKNERGEEYWRERATRIRDRLQQQRLQIAELQRRVETLSGLGGSTAGREKDLTELRLRQAQSDLGHLEQEWANFEATARAKNVPPAWIR